ncbi:hypothetical protein BC830DRAFT_1153710 [Chytriomyces sp. MP71]|nr:hypothetical protein BC830DRAFT_1153710 [Chytriomyces sp. MP71]
MHSPAFFLSLLALCALPLNAVPLQKRDGAAALPAYNQPESTKLDLGITFPALAARDSASANIDAVATTAASALAKSLSITPDEIKVSHA